jgi:hypothetical protein
VELKREFSDRHKEAREDIASVREDLRRFESKIDFMGSDLTRVALALGMGRAESSG